MKSPRSSHGRISPPHPLILPWALCLFLPVTSLAQSTSPPVHQHYEKPADRPAPAPGQPLAPRLQKLGVHTFRVSTKNARAQLFMNQGVNLSYAFNHAEAGRAFAEAARLDGRLAMAYWGQALVLGPNINAPMDPADEAKAHALIQQALVLKASGTPRERAFIEALSRRYTGHADDRARADRAYVEAMRAVVRRFPSDTDARTLLAEALMDLRPWNYWTRDGKAYDETIEIQSQLEQVLSLDKNHPGALHLWIHLWEATDTPERAEAEADRLLPLMPGAGHIVHMPAHIYMRVGRHADVISSNLLAAKADEDYITQCKAQGIYPLGYYPHNLHFIWMGATAAGQGTLALDAARRVAGAIPHEALANVPILQGFLVVPYWAMVRFEKWDEILADKGPRHQTPFTRGVWHYARGMAYVAKRQLAEAEQELTTLKALLSDESLKGQTTFSANSGFAILRIAPEAVAGEIAAARGEWDTATLHLDRAIRFEDALIYQEPHDWHAPVRLNLGHVLLKAGRADEAESVFWEDLKKNPESGWTLLGLLKAQRTQGKEIDAALSESRLKKAWKEADFRPASAGTDARPGSDERRGGDESSDTVQGPAAFSTATAADTRSAPRDTATDPGVTFVTLKSGVRLRYVPHGPATGPALIMLHGYSDSSWSFSRVLPLLPATLRAVAIDQRGHGLSARAPDYSMDAMARDVIDLMDALAIPTATLAGHSMGSFVARRAAVLAPDRVTRLVLLGAGIRAATPGMAELKKTVDRLTDPVDPTFVREFQYSTVALPVPEPFMQTVLAESHRLDASAWKRVLAGLVAYESAEHAIGVPTLVLGGDRDAVFSVPEQRAVAAAIRGARAVIVPGVGHTIHWEDPPRFVAELLAFLR